MPYRAKHPCAVPGCKNLTDGKYCDEHKSRSAIAVATPVPDSKEQYRLYDAERRDPEAKAFYNSTAWKLVRQQQLARQPLCAGCLKNKKITPATCVDHIREMKDGGAALDQDNLQSLCHACHTSKSMRARKKR